PAALPGRGALRRTRSPQARRILPAPRRAEEARAASGATTRPSRAGAVPGAGARCLDRHARDLDRCASRMVGGKRSAVRGASPAGRAPRGPDPDPARRGPDPDAASAGRGHLGASLRPWTARRGLRGEEVTVPEGCALCRSKGRPPTAVLDELHMQCEVCGCFGKPRALAGYCYCGARNWENTAPPVLSLAPPYPFGAEPTVPPRAIVAAGWQEDGREPPAAPAPARAPIRMVSGAKTTRKIVDDYEGARMNELLGGVMRGAVILIVGK